MVQKGARTVTTETIGIVAGVLTAVATVPQAISLFKHNSDSIHPLFLFILLTASALWLLYAVLTNVWRGDDESVYTGLALIIFQTLGVLVVSVLLLKVDHIRSNKKK